MPPPLLVIGSVALDTVETPAGKAAEVLGGSATYFAFAARLFSPVGIVGVVGEEFPAEHRRLMEEARIDLAGLKVVKGGKTFRWSGVYSQDLESRATRRLELNVFADFEPEIPASYRAAPFAFLANGSHRLQKKLLDRMEDPTSFCDTMDHWITNEREDLLSLLPRVDGIVLNEGEARLLTGDASLIRAADRILDHGARVVVIKKGQHGAMVASKDGLFFAPPFPTRKVVDPTGAGDSFAGGMMGHLARAGASDGREIRRAVIYGSAVASFCVEGFSLDGLKGVRLDDVEDRVKELKTATTF